MGEGGPKVHTSNYKVSQFGGCNVQHGDYSQQYCTVYLEIGKREDLKGFHQEEKKCANV